jgi:RES domain-containing protein
VIRIWRICKKRWAGTAMSGRGAAENPGRWNSPGRKAVYGAESRALAALEILAHTQNKRRLRRATFVVIPIDIPDTLIVRPTKYPPNWDAKPVPNTTRTFGDRHLDDPNYPVFRVPSAVVSGEFCFVINPEHPRFSELVIGRPMPFTFDDRVLSSEF